MYHIRRKENTEDAQIERTEPAVSYDKVTYENATKLMYRKPDGSIKRYWVGKRPNSDLEKVEQVFIMNNNGKTLEIL